VGTFLLDGAGLQFSCRLGLYLGFFLRVECVAFAFPAHFQAGAVVFDVTGGVAVQAILLN